MKLHHVISVASVLGAILSFNLQQEAKANVADDLYKNYNKIVTNCGSSDQPAYECSGNLVRLTSVSKYNVWDPNPHSVTIQSVSFTYLRHDIKVDLQFGDKLSGIIYYPPMITPADKESAEVTCAFPMDGWTAGRSDGCKRPGDNKTCQDLNIHTAEGWYQDFMSRPLSGSSRYVNQCGFAMTAKGQNIAQDFNENLKAINNIFDEKMLNADGTIPSYKINGYNEITIKPFPSDVGSKIINPEKLPIQAFFYMVKGSKSGLSDAQYYQQKYYQNTHIVVPIVKINDDDPANISFSYNLEDRGVTVADELNANYNKIVDNCGSKDNPAYECSGILFRQDSYNSNYHVWDPSPASIQRDGVSFAYLRKDIQFKSFMNASRNSGFIYYPSQQLPQEVNEARISCIFPATGWSNDRLYGRCGEATTYPKNSVECQQQGIYTADDWYKHLTSFGLDGYSKFQNQCGFDVSHCGHDTAKAFVESIKAHNMVYTDSAGGGSNEIIVRAFETDANGKTISPEKLPLQAFFYLNAAGLTEAQAYQQDYYKTTGKIVPVVYMNTTDFSNISFEYKTTDQAINNSSK